MRTDGQTDMTKVIVAFRNFGNAPKNGLENRQDVRTIRKRAVKEIPLQAWTGPEGFRRLRLPDFKTVGT